MIRVVVAALWCACCILGLCTRAVLAEEEEEAVVVYRKLQPSVVSLRNLEGGGTGILLDEKGLILTNAHVVTSPLPMDVQVECGQKQPVTFKKARIVGFHPTLDLALVKLDLSEHNAPLKPVAIAKTKPSPGQRVYAIGNPGAGEMVLSKTITSGMLSGVDREYEGALYHQFSAPINPGNSGGPLVDKTGKVLGVVTWKFSRVEGIAFAIPLDNLNLSEFVPLSKRKADPEKAKALLAEADKAVGMAGEHYRRSRRRDDRYMMLNAIAAHFYHMALVFDPNNPNIYYNVGMLLRTLDEHEIGSAYLLRGIQMAPWNLEDGREYRELGLSLVKDSKRDKGLAAWVEGITKYPRAGKIWEDMAVCYVNGKQYPEAGYCAAMALHLNEPDARLDVLRRIFADAQRSLSGADRSKFDARTEDDALAGRLEQMQTSSDAARTARKLYVTSKFFSLVEEMGGAECPDAATRIRPRPASR